MALPAAVQKQIDEANRIAAEIYPAAKAGDTPPAPNGEAPPPPAPPAPPAPAAGETPPPPAPLPTSDWEQRYKVLQGKYNAEVPRLQAQIRDMQTAQQNLQSQLVGTQSLLASLGQAAPRAASQSDGVPAGSVKKLVKDEEVTEFGADLYDFIKRAAAEAVLPQVDQRLKPVTQQLEKVSKTADSAATGVSRTEQQKVLDQLSAAVPNWTDVNQDEGFLAWLDQVDPYAGEPRGVLLQRAYQRHDGPRVVAFFEGFLKENATVSPATPPAPAPGTPAVTLESMVAPGTARAGSAAGAQDGAKRIWTPAEISQFYKDKANGKFNRNQKAATEIEADIFAAQREGRIR